MLERLASQRWRAHRMATSVRSWPCCVCHDGMSEAPHTGTATRTAPGQRGFCPLMRSVSRHAVVERCWSAIDTNCIDTRAKWSAATCEVPRASSCSVRTAGGGGCPAQPPAGPVFLSLFFCWRTWQAFYPVYVSAVGGPAFFLVAGKGHSRASGARDVRRPRTRPGARRPRA